MRFQWRHQYDDARDTAESNATAIDSSRPPENQKMKIAPDPDLPVQKHLAKDADINEIVRRAGIADGPPPQAVDRDFFEQPSQNFGPEITLQEVLDIQRRAQQHFDALPAKIRNYFQNDPARMHDFVNDPANAEKAVELGILRRVETKPSDADRIVEAVSKLAPPVTPVTPKTP